MAKVTMPQLGESVAEGTIGKWLKQPGDHVAKYEPLLEVITDKVNAEVPSPFEGILTEILAEEGATVPNDAEIAIIETGDESDAPAATGPRRRPRRPRPSRGRPTQAEAPGAGAGQRPPAPAPARRGRARCGRQPRIAGDPGRDRRPRRPDDPGRPPPAPRARPEPGPDQGHRRRRPDHPRRRAGRGRGDPDGRRPRPVAASWPPAREPRRAGAPRAKAPAGAPIAFPDGADEVLLPMTQMRKGIAAQMTRALAVPHAYVQMEVDATGLVRAREGAKREYQAREGMSLSYVPFVVKATVEALKQYPTFNAHWTDAGLLAKRRINIGVAVAVDDGLIVPVVRDVDQLSISGLNRAIADVAARARAGKLRLDDFGGGTFTIDNTGWLGSNLTMPIINVPEVAHPDDGGDHQAAGRRRDARGRRHRHPADHEHGPRRSTIAPTTAPRRPPSCETSRPGSRPSDPTRRSTDADAASSSPARPGSSAGSVVRRSPRAATRSSPLVRDPDAARRIWRHRPSSSSRSDLSRRAVADRARCAAPTASIHAAGSYRVGIPASERPAM